MKSLLLAALVGVLHVHHAPSHDSDASFEDVRQAAWDAGLDFIVLTEHADVVEPGPLPAAEHAGLHRSPDGRELLVMVGAEFGSRDGHVLGLGIEHTVPGEERAGREVIADIHAQGGFAVVPHPFSYGGWHDWDAPFDAMEVQNTAGDYRRLRGPLLPFRLVRYLFQPRPVLGRLWVRPDETLDRWEELLRAGRPVVGLAGADAHANTRLFGRLLDPYEQAFRGVRTICPGDVREPQVIWRELRAGRCRIRWAVYDARADEAREVVFPSGRTELQLDDGRRVLELRNPPAAGYTSPP